MVDGDNVGPFQMLYYAVFFTGGVYGLFIAGGEPPVTLRASMPHINVLLFYWINVLGPAMGFVGKAIESTKRDYTGILLRLGGNSMFCLGLLSYMNDTFLIESWGRGMYGAFPLATSSFLSTAFLVLRDLRRLLRVESRVRSERHGHI